MKNIKYSIEKFRLRRFPRYKKVISNIFNYPITLADKSSFMFMYEEIFIKKIYKFITANPEPVIIDCGANIGLSTIYFKTMYPQSKITSFEPDLEVFTILEKNIGSSGLKNVTLINKGLSKIDQEVSFFSEGADGGRIALESDDKKLTKVTLTKLSPYLQTHIDFLKIDIEGSETEVLEECKDYLFNVDHLFIEYHSLVNKPQQLDIILNILKNTGFRYYIEQVGITSQYPFIKFENHFDYDLQLNISATRL